MCAIFTRIGAVVWAAPPRRWENHNCSPLDDRYALNSFGLVFGGLFLREVDGKLAFDNRINCIYFWSIYD